MRTLDSIKDPTVLKNLSTEELSSLAREIRQELIETVNKNGGHLASNLGVVELSLALHKVFDFHADKLVFDVSHQGYTHKLLTGRQKAFKNIRRTDGLSGFLSRDESPYDPYGGGHAGCALSAALGMASGRDKKKEDFHVVSVIGDGALTCGLTMAAFNNISTTTERLIIVLNDNDWSIDKNVGAISSYLNELIINPLYNRLHDSLESFLKKFSAGQKFMQLGGKLKSEAKDFCLPSSLFEKYGLRYIGPIDGHNLKALEQYLTFCKHSKEPVLLHVRTKKGLGCSHASSDPEKFHGVSGGEKQDTSKAAPNYQDVFGDALIKFARQDPAIIAITAAMKAGTGLSTFAKELPDQFHDVGITEEHAVVFAAGLATQGFKPVCAIYSTFLQRAFDHAQQDVCLQKLPVLFCMDRAGLSPNDGPTHHGLYDISFLRSVPNSIIMQPKDEDELVDMIYTGLYLNKPAFIRYPRGKAKGAAIKEKATKLKVGEAEVLKEGKEIWLWTLGDRVNEMLSVAQNLESSLKVEVGVVNARFANPIDKQLLERQCVDANLIVTIEDHCLAGGFGTAVLEAIEDFQVSTLRIGWPNEFIPHASDVETLRKKYSLSDSQIEKSIIDKWKSLQL